MMKNMFRDTLLAFVLLPALTGSAVHGQVQKPKQPVIDLEQKLPTDPNITVGRLKNGLRYYIRENKKPEARAELRLVVNAGSVLEDDDQRGLAHFVEHMAFNGTKHFARQEIVDYLESIGMRFGPDINAYTSFDETVYMLQVPTDSAEVLETAFQILEDWAHNLSFDETEIDKERGVVIEEWRLGRGAAARIRDKQFPILLKGSRYAERLPIGNKDVLEHASYDALRRFYRDWYRPDLMAVVAVGDFNKDKIKKLIQSHFSRLEVPEHPRERVLFPVPDNPGTLYAIASDPEATGNNVSVYFKLDVGEQQTAAAYRTSLVESLYNRMLNNRLRELLKTPTPPFLVGFSSKGRFIRTKVFYVLGASVKNNGIDTGLEALLTEALRVKKHGFTQSELEREKAEMLRGIERAYNERDKTESASYAAEYIRNFLVDEPVPGIEYEFMLYNTLVPGIELQEVNRLAEKWLQDENRVVMVSVPEKEGIARPTEQELADVFRKVETKEIAAYEDKMADRPLVEKVPQAGEIVESRTVEKLGLTEWKLSNGVTVVLKPTDFKNDEVLFSAFSPGGTSLVADENYIPAVSAASIIREGGVDGFDQIALQKKLAGKIVNVSPWIDALQEGLSGSASPKDLETLFQLIYLYFTAPRKDSVAFKSFQFRINGFIQNRHASPEAAFQDTIQVTMARHHFRARPWTEDVLKELDLERSFRIYQDRFADASDFTFIFVGHFDPEAIKPLVLTYLGSLPALRQHETWRDVGIRPPKGLVTREVHKGLEPKSEVSLIFTGPFEWNKQNRYNLNAMTTVLRVKLREILREELSGTYGVGVWSSASRYPDEEYSVHIAFGCAPERVQELTRMVFKEIDSLKTLGTTEKYLQKVKETQRRQRETALKENGFWLRSLRSVYYHGADPMNIINYDTLIDNLTLEDIQTAAKRYLNTENYVRVVLYPEVQEENSRQEKKP